MESLKQTKTLTIYQLLRQDGMNFTQVLVSAAPSMGNGMFWKQEDAEMHRTFEYTKMPTGTNSIFHVFELTVPNPAYRE